MSGNGYHNRGCLLEYVKRRNGISIGVASNPPLNYKHLLNSNKESIGESINLS
jgi:hypothetical protein